MRVEGGIDAADEAITAEVAPDDLVVTADIPLAAEVVRRGAVAIDVRGHLYTAGTIGERLALRNLLQDLRSNELVRGGPAPFGAADRQRFASALDRQLTKKLNPK
jgi:uncharacterized protein YaiI (UPF0178 family)